ncbi:TY-Chap domain-containing protein [Methylobacterium marchantiae]|uniref:TY-Chap N-terminal domain-containing protein n=1 Tax=Methylobacterium marchantiae TaxID=600331 RepID=A0ABW3X146_9HYPH|nr:hypothetical protein AIGOOFII_2088 [Methylobacterium marchantiae]
MTTGNGTRAAGIRCIAALGIILAQSSHEASAASSRTAFIDRHRCAILTRLERIHQRGPVTTSRDRFIIVALQHSPQSYVQCIFFDNDTKMRCEASSGAFRYRPEDPVELGLSPDSLTTLLGLGFTRARPAENYSREVAIGTPPDLASVAELILTTLHDVYRADTTHRLSVMAPKADPMTDTCAEPSA